MQNNEIGWKTEFFDHRLQWNGAIYRENWNDVQVAFFDPGVVGNIFFNTNGQDFLIKGMETSLVARVTSGLTVQGAAPGTTAGRPTRRSCSNNNPASPGYGKPITEACNSFGTNCVPVTNPFGPIDSPSANAPPLQFSLRARYEWTIDGYVPFVQVGATHPVIRLPRRVRIRPSDREPSAPAGCGSRIPPTRPTMPRSASRRTTGG